MYAMCKYKDDCKYLAKKVITYKSVLQCTDMANEKDTKVIMHECIKLIITDNHTKHNVTLSHLRSKRFAVV